MKVVAQVDRYMFYSIRNEDSTAAKIHTEVFQVMAPCSLYGCITRKTTQHTPQRNNGTGYRYHKGKGAIQYDERTRPLQYYLRISVSKEQLLKRSKTRVSLELVMKRSRARI
jgi:hypothetical protein